MSLVSPGQRGAGAIMVGLVGNGLMKGGTRHLNVQVCSKKNTRGRRCTLLALCSHTHPHFNNSERRDIFASTSLALHSLALDALTFVGILSFLMGRALSD